MTYEACRASDVMTQTLVRRDGHLYQFRGSVAVIDPQSEVAVTGVPWVTVGSDRVAAHHHVPEVTSVQ